MTNPRPRTRRSRARARPPPARRTLPGRSRPTKTCRPRLQAAATSSSSRDVGASPNAANALPIRSLTVSAPRRSPRSRQRALARAGVVGAGQQAPNRGYVALTGLLGQQFEQLLLRGRLRRGRGHSLHAGFEHLAHQRSPRPATLAGQRIEAVEQPLGAADGHPSHCSRSRRPIWHPTPDSEFVLCPVTRRSSWLAHGCR